MRVACGWCGHATAPAECGYCGRDPRLPYLQRGIRVPLMESHEGRPPLDEADVRARYVAAVETIERTGRQATVEAIAEQLDRSPRTIRDWRKRYGL